MCRRKVLGLRAQLSTRIGMRNRAPSQRAVREFRSVLGGAKISGGSSVRTCRLTMCFQLGAGAFDALRQRFDVESAADFLGAHPVGRGAQYAKDLLIGGTGHGGVVGGELVRGECLQGAARGREVGHLAVEQGELFGQGADLRV